MARKAHYRPFAPENTRYVTDAVADDGCAMILKASQPSGGGVGQALDGQRLVAAAYAGAPPSGTKFLGVALNQVKNVDLSTYPRSSFKPTDTNVGEPVAIGEWCEVWTNKITGTPALEGDAYLAADSTFGTASVNGNGVVGKWKSTKDSDGYALLQVKAF
jgi:hypothetical protein